MIPLFCIFRLRRLCLRERRCKGLDGNDTALVQLRPRAVRDCKQGESTMKHSRCCTYCVLQCPLLQLQCKSMGIGECCLIFLPAVMLSLSLATVPRNPPRNGSNRCIINVKPPHYRVRYTWLRTRQKNWPEGRNPSSLFERFSCSTCEWKKYILKNNGK